MSHPINNAEIDRIRRLAELQTEAQQLQKLDEIRKSQRKSKKSSRLATIPQNEETRLPRRLFKEKIEKPNPQRDSHLKEKYKGYVIGGSDHEEAMEKVTKRMLVKEKK